MHFVPEIFCDTKLSFYHFNLTIKFFDFRFICIKCFTSMYVCGYTGNQVKCSANATSALNLSLLSSPIDLFLCVDSEVGSQCGFLLLLYLNAMILV